MITTVIPTLCDHNINAHAIILSTANHVPVFNLHPLSPQA